MQVKVRDGNVEAALRVFKKKSSEILWEVKKRQFYTKPSIAKNTSKKAAINRERKRKNK
jgi:ribosomal protein S21